MKSAARLKPKSKARASHDEFYSIEAQAKRRAAQYKAQNLDKSQSRPRESHHVRGMQLGAAASMLYTMNEWLASSNPLEEDEG